MQNWLIGSSGGGKSYEAVRYHVLPALEQGRHVMTNLPLVISEFEKINPEYSKFIHLRKKPQPILGTFTLVDDTPKFELFPDGSQLPPPDKRVFSSVWDYYFDDSYRNEKGQGPLIIVDECHLSIPRRDTDKQVEDWQSVHRHYNCDLLFITQSYGKCSAAICDNTQIVYRVRKNIAFGSKDSYIRKVQDGFRGDIVNTSIREYDPKYFSLYKSHTQGVSVEEFGANDITPLWKRWPFIGLAISIILFLALLPKACSNNPFDAKKYQKKDITQLHKPETLLKPKTPQQPPQQPPQQTLQQPQPDLSVITTENKPLQPTINQPIKPPLQQNNLLNGHGVHIVGFNEVNNKKLYFFLVSQNANSQFIVTSKQLEKAGYTFDFYSPCLALIEKEEFQAILSCDSPTLLNISPSARS